MIESFIRPNTFVERHSTVASEALAEQVSYKKY